MNQDFTAINQPLSNEITINNKHYLYFGGTAYLGIPNNEEFQNLYISGIRKFGLNNGTSRNNNTQLGIYNEAEAFASDRFGAEDCLITSSGYLAAQLAVQALNNYGEVIYAPGTHPALWMNEKPTSMADTFSRWSELIVTYINESANNNWVLVSNSMNNLFPEVFDFSFVKMIDNSKQVLLIVDDSHGIGVNNNGLGAFKQIPKPTNIEIVVVASMAKAPGIDAGIILSSKSIIRKLKNSNIFAGASPPAAAGLYAFMKAHEIYKIAYEKLQHNIGQFANGITGDWSYAKGFPAFLVNDSKIDQRLLSNNILISSFPYPDLDSPPINRVVLSSWHTAENIRYLLDVLTRK